MHSGFGLWSQKTERCAYQKKTGTVRWIDFHLPRHKQLILIIGYAIHALIMIVNELHITE